MTHKNDSGVTVPHKVFGELRYYPHNGAGETRPNLSYKADSGSEQEQDGHAGPDAPSSSGGGAPPSVPSSGASPGSKDTGLMDVFWQHRLVPESSVRSLPFLPTTEAVRRQRDKLGQSCLSRLHGSIFFQWDFPISNNKLRLNAAKDNQVCGLTEVVLAGVLHVPHEYSNSYAVCRFSFSTTANP